MSARSADIDRVEVDPSDMAHQIRNINDYFQAILINEQNKPVGGNVDNPTTPSDQATSLVNAAGLDSEIAGASDTGVAVEVVSDGSGDTDIDVIVYGFDDADEPQIETIVTDGSDGTTPVAGTALWNAVFGARIAAAAGTISVTKVSAGANIITGLATGTLTKGLVALTKSITLDTVKVTADGATTKRVIIVGTDSEDAELLDEVLLTGAVEAAGDALFKTLTYAVTGEVEVARTLSLRSSMGDLTWSYDRTALEAVVGGVYEQFALAADAAIHASAFLDGLEIGSSCIAAVLIKNDSGTLSLDAVKGTPAVTGAQRPPSDAVIQAALGAGVSWVKLAHCLLNRTANATLTESQDNQFRPILGVTVNENFGVFTD